MEQRKGKSKELSDSEDEGTECYPQTIFIHYQFLIKP